MVCRFRSSIKFCIFFISNWPRKVKITIYDYSPVKFKDGASHHSAGAFVTGKLVKPYIFMLLPPSRIEV